MVQTGHQAAVAVWQNLAAAETGSQASTVQTVQRPLALARVTNVALPPTGLVAQERGVLRCNTGVDDALTPRHVLVQATSGAP